MNELIEKLVIETLGKQGVPERRAFGHWAMSDEQMVKFAELIVRECMSVARQQRDPSNLNYKPSERFVEELRQHFGVEE